MLELLNLPSLVCNYSFTFSSTTVLIFFFLSKPSIEVFSTEEEVQSVNFDIGCISGTRYFYSLYCIMELVQNQVKD